LSSTTDDAGVGFGPDQAAYALPELQNRFGNENSLKELPPRASIASIPRFHERMIRTANGSRVMMTLLNASPGTSTHLQQAVCAETNRVHVVLEFFQLSSAACLCPAQNTRPQGY